jgi:hypothetical protein
MIQHSTGEFNGVASREASRPVAGTAGDFLPGLLVDPVGILFDRKIPAAPRAAERDRPSADPELDRFSADLAVHKTHRQEKRNVTGFLLSQE